MERLNFELPDDLGSELFQSIVNGLIAEIDPDGHHQYYIEKAQVDRVKGMKIEIYAKEHSPPHFHVKYSGDEAVFDLQTGAVLHAAGQAKKITKNVELYYADNRIKLIEFWNKMRPEDCPVGPVVP